MHTYLDQPIKPLMEAHPGLGHVLSDAGIGCTTCSLGTCRVRDILEIHNLDTQGIQALLQAMGRVLFGEQPFDVPVIQRTTAPPKATFCPPIQRMVAEHTVILRVVDQVPSLVAALERDLEGHRVLATQTLDFIRSYADHYHHAKEEDVLFGYFDGQSDILGVMTGDHETGRALVRTAAAALEARDLGRFGEALHAWADLLRSHIQREDTILYPWMDRSLSLRQVGELFSRCAAVDAREAVTAREHEAFAEGLPTALKG